MTPEQNQSNDAPPHADSDGPARPSQADTDTEDPQAGTDAADLSQTAADDEGDGAAATPSDDLDLAAQVELLTEENRRLRAEYARAKKSEYRRTALGLAGVGLVAILGGLLFADGREVLFAFGLTGLFGAVLTLYLSPSRIVAADVGERVYAAMAENDAAIATQLGIEGDRVYVPGTETPAYLYCPDDEEYEIPDVDEGPIVVTERRRGLFLEATGAFLFEEFERALAGDLASEPQTLATQLADGAVEQFELADAVDFDAARDDGRVTFRVTESAFGSVDRFDHPLTSFLAAGLAAGRDRPVTVTVDDTAEYADWLITCRWKDKS